jgi:hypothetical protein
MIGRIKMPLIVKIIEYLDKKNIPADIIECDVWKGVRKADDEYFQKDTQFILSIDKKCRLIFKNS